MLAVDPVFDFYSGKAPIYVSRPADEFDGCDPAYEKQDGKEKIHSEQKTGI